MISAEHPKPGLSNEAGLFFTGYQILTLCVSCVSQLALSVHSVQLGLQLFNFLQQAYEFPAKFG